MSDFKLGIQVSDEETKLLLIGMFNDMLREIHVERNKAANAVSDKERVKIKKLHKSERICKLLYLNSVQTFLDSVLGGMISGCDSYQDYIKKNTH